ncbi:hypothetical protein DW019_11095 [Clostridium sp. AF37-5]|jgi:hypothetical protein|uniref:hypothetical protein n=1 Tax=Clostridium sp. AF37-5 TaxID=2293016 RepID=UPI000E54CB4B|nr:hypothetical protein [Clostridium sp. AF37-5]RHO95790.1 hypothetical protein DW019_11095 [Clostridium sp. AF37-5]
MLEIKIKTSGAAYDDGDGLTFAGRCELQRNLTEISRDLADGRNNGNIMDINGNKVGKWFVD